MQDYMQTTYDAAKAIIHEDLASMSKKFITIGFYLKYIRDNEMYVQDGYSDIWAFAQETYGISKSTCSRWMSMNDKFSKSGNSPYLKDEYRDFGKSQLQEMLYLSDEQIEQAAPEMTAKEIRAIRKPERKEDDIIPEQMSILGYPKREYPEDSLIATAGCGKNDCFSCHRGGCDIRQQDCYCVEAPMGKPFPCDILKGRLDELREGLGCYWNTCQFLNLNLAEVRAGDGEPVPCCKDCKSPCRYQCRRAAEETLMQGQEKLNKLREDVAVQSKDNEPISVAPAQQEPGEDKTEVIPAEMTLIPKEYNTDASEELSDIPRFSQKVVCEYLKDNERELKEYLACEGLPERVLLKKQMVVAGLRLLMRAIEEGKYE